MADRGLGTYPASITVYAGDYTRTYINQNYPGAIPNLQRITGAGNASYIDILIEIAIASYIYSGTDWLDSTNAQIYDGTNWKPYAGSKVFNGTEWVDV